MKLTLPERYFLLFAMLVGIAAGIGGYTFLYARGSSYLTNDPSACANCHIMREHFNAWAKSSHHAVAVCNDCHTPHEIIPKYMTKARNGFWHSFYFTSGRFPDPIRILPKDHAITEHACRRCHQPIVDAIDAHTKGEKQISCTRCHPNVGHWVR